MDKVLVISRFDYIAGRKDGGAEISYRNCSLLEKIYGKDNVKICMITANHHQDTENIKFFHTKDNLLFNYFNYLLMRDKINRKLENEIVEYINSEKPELIFFDGSTFGQFVERLDKSAKSVIFFHNIERQYTWDQVKRYSWLCIFRYIANRVNERKMVLFSNNYICMNKRDAKLLKRYYHVEPDFIFPATFDDRKETFSHGTKGYDKAKSQGYELLFIGSYFAHNYKGLVWFINHVLPYVDCHLTIVGKNMEKLREKVQSEKLTIAGTVECLDDYYFNADALIMPIFMGGGMKVKTAEALMYGKTLIASPEAVQGYDIEKEENVYVCSTAEEFINAINAYSKSPSRKKYNENLRTFFLEKYSTAAYEKGFHDYLKTLNKV